MQKANQKNRNTEAVITSFVIIWGLLSFYAGQSPLFPQDRPKTYLFVLPFVLITGPLVRKAIDFFFLKFKN
jgi:hypothetical protein